MTLLHDPARHEPLQAIAWDEARVRSAIEEIAADAEQRYDPARYWPQHPRDLDPGDDPQALATSLYFGACGVIWALHYLQDAGAVRLQRGYLDALDLLRERNRAWLADCGFGGEAASYLMGDTPILLLGRGRDDELGALIAANVDHPARELMWGAPGTMLAALFLHRRSGEARWADHFRAGARRLWEQLEGSETHGVRHWTQDLYGRRSTYLDAVHGFAGTAAVLIHGRELLEPAQWERWQRVIVDTVARTAQRQGNGANWPALLDGDSGKRLMQHCHGAPGFVTCLAALPGRELDELLEAAAEATWAAGPLAKGANLCHGTGGNGYAFLKLHERSGDPRWLQRARAFAMHALVQSETEAAALGRRRYSLWTGDLGLAIYLWDCLRGRAAFPTLDVWDATAAPPPPS